MSFWIIRTGSPPSAPNAHPSESRTRILRASRAAGETSSHRAPSTKAASRSERDGAPRSSILAADPPARVTGSPLPARLGRGLHELRADRRRLARRLLVRHDAAPRALGPPDPGAQALELDDLGVVDEQV